jgi:hypothetical protein
MPRVAVNGVRCTTRRRARARRSCSSTPSRWAGACGSRRSRRSRGATGSSPTTCGASASPTRPAPPRLLAGAVGGRVEDARGLSMGGNIALNLTLAHPGTVTKLILCDTGAGSEDAAAFKTRCEEYAQAAEKINLDEPDLFNQRVRDFLSS